MVGISLLLGAVSVGYWAVLVYLPLFLTLAFGWSPEASGLAMLAATLPMLVVPPLGGRIVIAIGWRRHFAVALALVALANLLLSSAAGSPQPTLWLVISGMAIAGCGAALAHPQLSGAVVAMVPAEQAGMASAVTVVMRQAGFAVGIASLGSMLGSPDRITAFHWPFIGAALASASGVMAAALLLSPKFARADQP